MTMSNGQICYDLTVRDVRLVTTGKGADGQVLGVNRIMVYFNEAPADRPLDFGSLRVACLDTRYVDGAVKAPPNGLVTLKDAQFTKLGSNKSIEVDVPPNPFTVALRVLKLELVASCAEAEFAHTNNSAASARPMKSVCMVNPFCMFLLLLNLLYHKCMIHLILLILVVY